MPYNATQIAGADYVVGAVALPKLLTELVHGEAAVGKGESDMVDPIEHMPAIMHADMEEQIRNRRRGSVSTFTCPECGGSLRQVDEKDLVRFRCHVGHAYNGEALLAKQNLSLEAALWSEVRTFREKFRLSRRLAEQQRAHGAAAIAARYEEQAQLAEHYGGPIIQYILGGPGGANRSDPGEASLPELKGRGGEKA
jgi:two-component system chemotaxis response regulator CheB